MLLIELLIEGKVLASCILAVVTLLIGLIYFLRNYISGKGRGILKEKYQNTANKSLLLARNKYPEVDVFKLSRPIFSIGLIVALGVMILAFNWTTYENIVEIPDVPTIIDEDIEVDIPPTTNRRPPPPPPPPVVIEKVPETDPIEADIPDFVDPTLVELPSIVKPTPIVEKKMVPPEIIEVEDDIPPFFRVVEEMPRFPSSECEAMADKKEKKQCADKAMLNFIYSNIKYPAIAREIGAEGRVVVSFIVETDGRISEAKILRDIGAQCGKETLRVVELMNKKELKWYPGKQRGKAVRVQFNLPVKFALRK